MAGDTDSRGVDRVPTNGAALAVGEVTASYPELLDQVPAIIYIADTGNDGRWHYVSPQIKAILGFSPEEWRADPTLWSQRLHPDDRERITAAETAAAAGAADPRASEYRMHHRDGHIVWIRDDALLVGDADGAMRWHGVMSDITERKRAEVELERRAAQQSAVARLGEHALEGATTSELMQEAVSGAAEILEVERAAVLELIAEEECFVLRSGVGWPQSMIGDFRFPADSGTQPGFTILSSRPVVVSDWEYEQRFAQTRVLTEMGTRSGLSVPIEGPSSPFGVLGVQSTQPARLRAGGHRLSPVAGQRARRRARASGDRGPDPPPRAARSADRPAQSGPVPRPARSGAGPAAAPPVVRRRSCSSTSIASSSSTTASATRSATSCSPPRRRASSRRSGPATPWRASAATSSGSCSRTSPASRTPSRWRSGSPRCSPARSCSPAASTSSRPASASRSPRAAELAEELIRDADAAMYRAKERGRARYELFDEVMRGRAMARLRVENDLRRALERDELRLDYQPVVSLRDESIVGVEALLRWDHPERGLIAPAEFIPIAEEDGLIEPIGRWVLERGVPPGRAWWHRARPDAAPIGMSVNLSAVQVANPALAERGRGHHRAPAAWIRAA